MNTTILRVLLVLALGPALALGLVAPAHATPPGAPTGVTALAGDGQVKVTWTAPAYPGDSPVQDYLIEGSTDGGTTWGLYDYTATAATAWTIGGLVNGTGYAFRVRAGNATDVSAPSTATGVVTPTAAGSVTVPGAPSGVGGVPGDGKVTVAWTAPATTGGSPILGYRVLISEDGGSTYGVAAETGATTSVVVPGLANGTAYLFAVGAYNANGRGAWTLGASAVTPNGPVTPPGGAGGASGPLITIPGIVSATATAKVIKGSVQATAPACASSRPVQVVKGTKVLASGTTTATGAYKVRITRKLRKAAGTKKVRVVAPAVQPGPATACAAASSLRLRLGR